MRAHGAGTIRPRTSPKPMRPPAAPGAVPVRTTSSPSSRNVRCSPLTVIGSRPPQVSSMKAPRWSFVRAGDRAGGEQVAGARRRPVDGHVRQHLRGRPVHLPVRRAADHVAVPLDGEVDVESPRCAPAQVGQRLRVSWPGRGTRAASSASSGTTQGDTDVAKLLPRCGPSGTYSHACRSRADQSLTSTAPKTCSAKASTGIGAPSGVPTPTTKPELGLDVEPGARAEGRRGLGGVLALPGRADDRRCRRRPPCRPGRGSRRAGASSSA